MAGSFRGSAKDEGEVGEIDEEETEGLDVGVILSTGELSERVVRVVIDAMVGNSHTRYKGDESRRR